MDLGSPLAVWWRDCNPDQRFYLYGCGPDFELGFFEWDLWGRSRAWLLYHLDEALQHGKTRRGEESWV